MGYLNREDVRGRIGAKGGRFRECAGGVTLNFARTGDSMFLPILAYPTVIA